jgi:CBS domain-containing protein
VGAALGARAVTATYTANDDTFCLRCRLPRCAPAGSRQRAVGRLPQPPRAAVFGAVAPRAAGGLAQQPLAEQSLEAPLSQLVRTRRWPGAATPLAEALHAMHERRIGSVLVLDEQGAAGHPDAARHPGPGGAAKAALDVPIGEVMSAPVHTLTCTPCAGRGAADVAPRHAPCAGDDHGRAWSTSCPSATCSRCSACRSSR